MKLPLLLTLILLSTSTWAGPRRGQSAPAPTRAEQQESVSASHAAGEPATAPVEQLALDGRTLSRQLATLTGVAMSPLLGMGLLGASAYLQAPAEARSSIP